jgi:alkanesulfonate monooxygenase SsuD/methylene tetrahydromethanopterin reductase-like flavin-dependent oxidoreductase (luciferase family)
MAAAPAHVGDTADGRDRVRWFPALVGNHVVDLVTRYRGDLPESLTHYVRGRQDYDYLHHAEVGSSNASFVTDDIVDRFAIVGDVQAHVARLRILAEAGVDQFNLYLMNGNEDEQLEIYGREIIPVLRDVPAVKP